MKVLLVAKPWRGGLAQYLRTALDSLLPNTVEWLPTYPVSVAERIAYRRGRAEWRNRLLARVAATDCDAAIFINHLSGLEAVVPRREYVLWITDDPRPLLDKTSPYGRVYISDPGYRNEVSSSLDEERFGGVLPFGYLPAFHRPLSNGSRGRGFCFIGNRDPKRDSYLRYLCSYGVDITVYGNYWPFHGLTFRYPRHFRPRVAIERMGRVYARHLASVNIHAKVVKGGTNMRTFECAGYCIAQIVERLPGLETLFSPGEDLLTFENPDELMEQMSRLEADPEFARSLAVSAGRRARARHTYFHRARTLLDGLVDIPQHVVTQLAEG